MTFQLRILALALICATACSEPLGSDGSTVPGDDKVEVVISGIKTSTRTSLGDDGRTTQWSVGDNISVWASSGSSWALNAQPFTLYTFNSQFSSADFSANVTPMESGTYTYYAVYPQPESINGTTVTYTIPTLQKGTYQGAYDVMVAAPVTGAALDRNPRDELALSFRHLLHMVRIEIPADRNLFGQAVKRLEIAFPTEVAGSVSFDATAPEQTLAFTNGSRTINIEFDGTGISNTDQMYVYAFVRPCELNGDIRFRAFNAQGAQSNYISTSVANRTLQAGHVTPIKLTIPTPRPLTYLDFKIAANNLGETPTSITLKLPNGIVLSNGKSTATITPDTDGCYTATVYYDDQDDTNSALPSSEFTIDYESENAKLTNHKITMPASISKMQRTNISMTVPYLFDEDFSTTSGDEYNYKAWDGGSSVNGNAMDGVGLMGWTGARWETSAGTSLSISAYIGTTAFNANLHNGRVDSRQMPIKAGKSVSLEVTYNVSGSGGASNGTSHCYFGTTTREGVINGATGKGNNSTPDNQIDNFTINNGGNASNIPTLKSYPSIAGCTSATRLTWCCNVNKSGLITAKFFYIYVDNIKVKIVQ